MTRHQQRELAMTCVYQSLLLKKDIKKVLSDNTNQKEIDPFLYTITIDMMKHVDFYKDKINSVLKQDWDFSRLSFVNQAILLIACCELDFETASKAIIIDEAINITKKYCDDEDYKLINGVLDQL